MHTLTGIGNRLGDLLLTNVVSIPNLPFWGPNGNIAKYYYANEFEILGVFFRIEVERFLFIFDEHYNFLTDLPRNPDLITSPVIQPKTRDLPPHQPDQMRGNERIPTPTTRTNARGRNPKQGEAVQRMAQSYRHNLPGNRPPTSRMREVLDNIGGTFGNDERPTRNHDKPASSALRTNQRQQHPGGPPDDDSDDDDEDNHQGNPRPAGRLREPRRPPNPPPQAILGVRSDNAYFYSKLPREGFSAMAYKK